MSTVARLYDWQERLGVIAAEMTDASADIAVAWVQMAYAQTREAWRREAADEVAYYAECEAREQDT